MRALIATVKLAGILGAASFLAGAQPELAYTIDRLGNAESATLARGGANGSAHAFLLTHVLGNWARFNWPRFLPVAGTAAVRFHVRRAADRPDRFRVRVLHVNGTEWQSPLLDVPDEWTAVTLTAADFELFRGGDPNTTPPLDLAQATQFQLVPDSGGDGTGRLLVDDIRFLPDGPGFAADGDDLQTPISAGELQRRRLRDLLHRWRTEERRLDARAQQARTWLAELQTMRAQWANGRQDAVRERLLRGDLPWQEPVADAVPETSAGPADAALAPEAWAARLRELGARSENTLLNSTIVEDALARARASTLYAAVDQSDPVRAAHAGETVLRYPFVFTDDDARQTVFANLELATMRDVTDHTVVMRLRCTATALNDTYPMLLRIHTAPPGGGESWADFRPDPMPGQDVTEVRFDTTRPVRGVAFTPARATAFALRLENAPGVPQEFVLDIAGVSVVGPAPQTVLFQDLLDNALAGVHSSRKTLYALRDHIGRTRLLLPPDLRALYDASFRTARAHVPEPGPPPAPVFEETTLPEHPLRPYDLLTRTRIDAGGTVLDVTCTQPSVQQLLVELTDGEGRLRASARGAGGGVSMRVDHLPVWTAASANLFEARIAAVGADGQLVAADRRRLGLRSVRAAPGGPTPLLRAPSGPGTFRGPDWSLLWNGQPMFARMARYTVRGDAEVLPAVDALLDELWLDGMRDYGFRDNRAVMDACDRLGILQLASFAPSCRALTGWQDIANFVHNMEIAYRLLQPRADTPSRLCTQVGNEVELPTWGADLSEAFPGALYHPLDMAAEHARRTLRSTAPVMYVRAGSFRGVPPLPHEDICGVNQYTGRYSGRVEEIDRNLAELARHALLCDRPLMITEWMGPKYSWASSGVGGVTRRGAAYYLERYWRAMINTPGIVGSSEFTLNWVIAPFEDLTTQTREQAWVNRPEHTPFGGGRTADHVPIVQPADVVRGPCFRSMQAFQSPLYVMVNRPGRIRVAFTPATRQAAETVAADVRACGKTVDLVPVDTPDAPAAAPAHLVILLGRTPAPPALQSLMAAAGFATPPADEPAAAIQTRLHPHHADRLVTVLTAASDESCRVGLERVLASARALAELNALEGAMSRVVALTDKNLRRYYERHLLEFAGRGFIHGGDDTREDLDATEFYGENGRLRPAWGDLSAIILDCTRTLSETDMAVLDRFVDDGVDLIISRPCYAANDGLRQRFPATLTDRGWSLADNLPVAEFAAAPAPVRNMGGAELDRIARFRPGMQNDPALTVVEVTAPGAAPVVTGPAGTPAAVRWQRDRANVYLFGTAIGDVTRIHWSVTHAGQTHSLYDRDTACGLERLHRVVINSCRAGQPERRPRPRLHLITGADASLLPADAPFTLTVTLCNVEEEPVPGQLRARIRTAVDGRAGASSEWMDLRAHADGRYRITCRPAASPATGTDNEFEFEVPSKTAGLVTVSLQVKGWATGYIPADGALALALE